MQFITHLLKCAQDESNRLRRMANCEIIKTKWLEVNDSLFMQILNYHKDYLVLAVNVCSQEYEWKNE